MSMIRLIVWKAGKLDNGGTRNGARAYAMQLDMQIIERLRRTAVNKTKKRQTE